MNSIYRFKHIATEKYLSVDSRGKCELQLKEGSPLQYIDTLFILRPISREQELDDEDDGTPDVELFHDTKIFIETYFNSFLQIYYDIEDESQQMFTYKDPNKHEMYNVFRSKTQVNIIAGHKQDSCDEG